VTDQLIIGNKASYDDFEANVRERKIPAPKKKSIKDSVPFSNETYDFSAINGEVYWEERMIEYVLEIWAATPEELEEKKQNLVSWLMNVSQEELHDPFILDYHFLATFNDIDINDTEIEKSTMTVKFTTYPYKISNDKKLLTYNLTESETIKAYIRNDSSHRITPTFISEVPFVLEMNGSTYSVPSGRTKDYSFWFAPDVNELSLRSAEGSGTLKIEFCEEVF